MVGVRATVRPLEIGPIGRTSTPDGCRVAAEVDGRPLWFESAAATLEPVAEAFASALLIPSLASRRPLRLADPLGSRWRQNLPALFALLAEWWGYPALPPIAPEADPPAPARAGSALCFSAGVDSFYSLLRRGETPELLLSVHGFDIPLADEARMAGLARSLAEIAAAVGSRPVVVRTNLRLHPAALAVRLWERTHGGALAAVGHLLSGEVGRLLVSSSIAYEVNRPWGTHWRLDPLWSSERLAVAEVGAEMRRSRKLRAIATEPLVQRHLRVCWENRSSALNCSRCHKCVRTMVVLADCDELDRFTVFERGSLVERIDGVRYGSGAMRYYREIIEAGSLGPEVGRALERLLARTERRRRRERLLGRIRRWVGVGA